MTGGPAPTPRTPTPVADFHLDSNVFDALVADEPTRRAAVAAVAAGRACFFTTHIQEDELSAVPDPWKYWRIASIPRQIVPTSDFIVGVSRLGMARLGAGSNYNKIRVGLNHVHDAILAATAE